MVTYKKLSLDWDNYQYSRVEAHKKEILSKLNEMSEKITIFEGNKGLNVILDLKKEISYRDLVFWRVALFDDPFRIQNDMQKKYSNDEERINRIWLWKNGVSKKVVFNFSKISEKQFEEMLKILKTKTKKKKEVLK